jgi:hypothetical protein
MIANKLRFVVILGIRATVKEVSMKKTNTENTLTRYQ